MAKININVTSVKNANSKLPSCEAKVKTVRNSINSVRCNIRADVKARNNIANSLNNLYYEAEKIESSIHELYNTVNKCADIYAQADDSVKKRVQYVSDWK